MAREMEGLDEETGVSRSAIGKTTDNDGGATKEDLMMRGIDLLVKAVSARYRLSPKAEEELADSISKIVRGVGGQLMPERFDDG